MLLEGVNDIAEVTSQQCSRRGGGNVIQDISHLNAYKANVLAGFVLTFLPMDSSTMSVVEGWGGGGIQAVGPTRQQGRCRRPGHYVQDIISVYLHLMLRALTRDQDSWRDGAEQAGAFGLAPGDSWTQEGGTESAAGPEAVASSDSRAQVVSVCARPEMLVSIIRLSFLDPVELGETLCANSAILSPRELTHPDNGG